MTTLSRRESIPVVQRPPVRRQLIQLKRLDFTGAHLVGQADGRCGRGGGFAKDSKALDRR